MIADRAQWFHSCFGYKLHCLVIFFLGAFLILYLNLLALEGMPLRLLEFVFGQRPRKGEKVSVENACSEEKKEEKSQMTFKCTGEEEHDSQQLFLDAGAHCQSKPLTSGE